MMGLVALASARSPVSPRWRWRWRRPGRSLARLWWLKLDPDGGALAGSVAATPTPD